VADGKIFAMERVEIDGTGEESLRRVAEQSLSADPGWVREFDLVASPELILEPRPNKHYLLGGQFLAAKKGTRIEVDLKFRLTGKVGHAVIRHDLVTRGAIPRFRPRRMLMSSGQSARLHYSYLTPRDLDRIEARMTVNVVGQERVTMLFESALIRLIPDAGGQPGVTKHAIWLNPGQPAAQTSQ
jgi:hypothetical protein